MNIESTNNNDATDNFEMKVSVQDSFDDDYMSFSVCQCEMCNQSVYVKSVKSRRKKYLTGMILGVFEHSRALTR
ncbi:hypothetical protein WA026_013166 [Henosepilachna vigintioctopunctata]|uniref:Uncharacterized protein n=1 Tax=Henosepilachna vigintioctopunctata TaxID=420089 RepID=A0AAW1UE92_9CUCU